MGSCCSCFESIRGGKRSREDDYESTEMTSQDDGAGLPPLSHGLSRAMSAPTIRIQGFKVSGSGLALATVPIEQDAAYWEWHVCLPHSSDPHLDEEEDLQDVQMNGEGDADNNSQYAVKFGVATRKDRNIYKLLEDSGEETEDASNEDHTGMMRPIPNLRHNDVIGVAVQQSDLPMIQFLLNGEPLPQCTINRFRGTVYPAVYIPPGAGGEGERVEDEGIALIAEFEENNFKEMSPHARFGPLLAARGII